MRLPLHVFIFAVVVATLCACGGSPTARSAYVFPPDLGRTHFEILTRAEGTGTVVVAKGDVRDVIAGAVPGEADAWHDARRYRIGFGAGSPRDIESLGEFMALGGTAYAKSTDSGAPDYYETIHGRRFVTTASIFVPRNARPNIQVTHLGRRDVPMSLERLYEIIYEAAGYRAFVVAGMVEFDRAETLAVSRPPIFGEPLFEHRERYYAFGPETREGVFAVVMGCAARFADETDPERHAQLERILYNNPYDTAEGLVSHAHALILREEPEDWRRVAPGDVLDVDHLLSQSTLRSAWLDVYLIDGVE